MISEDNYTLQLEGILTESSQLGQMRAIAQNTTTNLTVEAQFSGDHAHSLLARVYKEDHLNAAVEQLESGYPTVLQATADTQCIFTKMELVEFGFDPLELAWGDGYSIRRQRQS